MTYITFNKATKWRKSLLGFLPILHLTVTQRWLRMFPKLSGDGSWVSAW
jgi:hypothetical protein